mgnify:CR=1 FL=1
MFGQRLTETFLISCSKTKDKTFENELKYKGDNDLEVRIKILEKILELEKQITVLSSKRDEVLVILGDTETYEMSTSDLKQIIMKKKQVVFL